jgi:hypothetical protein
MKKTFAFLATMVLALAVTGCFQHTYVVGAGTPVDEVTGIPDAPVVYKHWHHHWLFGLIRPKLQKQMTLEDFCPSGNATIHEEVSFVNGVVDVLIGIIYSPTTVTVYCDDGSKAEVEVTEEKVARLIADPLFLSVVEEVLPDRLSEARAALSSPQGRPRGVGEDLLVAP